MCVISHPKTCIDLNGINTNLKLFHENKIMALRLMPYNSGEMAQLSQTNQAHLTGHLLVYMHPFYWFLNEIV